MIQVESEVAGEMIEYEIAAVERLQHQDLAHWRLSSPRPRCERQQTKQCGNRHDNHSDIWQQISYERKGFSLQPWRLDRIQRNDMQDRPASILAISETWSGTTITPCVVSMSMVRGHLALTSTHSLTRSALAAQRLLTRHHVSEPHPGTRARELARSPGPFPHRSMSSLT